MTQPEKRCVDCGEIFRRLTRGRCVKHYNVWYRANPPGGSLCRAPGCTRMANIMNEYCRPHAERAQRGTDLARPIAPRRRWENKTCRGPECDRLPHSLGLCPSHWNQQYYGKPLMPIRKPSIFDEHCTYAMAHYRPTKLWGSAKRYPCMMDCGRRANEWAYDGTDPDELFGPNQGGAGISYIYYSRFPEFYMPMCTKCHRKKDLGRAFTELQTYREWKHKNKNTELASLDQTFDNINAAMGKLLEMDFDAIFDRAEEAMIQDKTA